MPGIGQMIINEHTLELEVFDGKNWVPCGSDSYRLEGEEVTFLPNPTPPDISMEFFKVGSEAIRNSIDKEIMELHKKEQEKAYNRAMKGLEHE